jgi:hypothetical protein
VFDPWPAGLAARKKMADAIGALHKRVGEKRARDSQFCTFHLAILHEYSIDMHAGSKSCLRGTEFCTPLYHVGCCRVFPKSCI